MSWIFGVKTGQNPPTLPDMQLPTGSPGGGGGGGGGDDDKNQGQGGGSKNSRMEAYTFDSAALERAAKAAKDLEKSGVCF